MARPKPPSDQADKPRQAVIDPVLPSADDVPPEAYGGGEGKDVEGSMKFFGAKDRKQGSKP